MPSGPRARTLRALAGGLAALALAAEAAADALSFTATHTIKFSFNGQVKEASASGTGVAIINGGAGGAQIQTLELTGPFATIDHLSTATTQEPLGAFRLDGVRAFRKVAPFAGAGGMPGVFAPIFTAAQSPAQPLTKNTLPAAGTVVLCKIYDTITENCAQEFPIPLSQQDLGVAIGPGVGGDSFTVTFAPDPSFVRVKGEPWTIHETMVSYTTFTGFPTPMQVTEFITEAGFAQGPASAPSSTALPGGVVQLVSGVQTESFGFNQDVAGQVGILRIEFTPEPGMLALFGGGAAAMALLGRRRSRLERRGR